MKNPDLTLYKRLSKDLDYISKMIEFGESIFTVDRQMKSLNIDRSENPYRYSITMPIDVMGEQLAHNKLSYQTLKEYREIDWRGIRRMQNELRHAYEEVDFDEVYNWIDHKLSLILEGLYVVKLDLLIRLNLLNV